MRAWYGVIVLLAALAAPPVQSFKAGDFKTCSQSGFCKRGRALANRATENSAWKSPYSIDANSIVVAPGQPLTAGVKSSLYLDIKFSLDVRIHEDHVVRVRMDEVDGLRNRYDEAASWALIQEPTISRTIPWTIGKKDVRVFFGANKELELVVDFDPLRITLRRDGKDQVVLNGEGLLHMEHFRNKQEPPAAPEVSEEGSDGDDDAQTAFSVPNERAWFEGDEEVDFWEERFNSWTDSKPKGKW